MSNNSIEHIQSSDHVSEPTADITVDDNLAERTYRRHKDIAAPALALGTGALIDAVSAEALRLHGGSEWEDTERLQTAIMNYGAQASRVIESAEGYQRLLDIATQETHER